MYIKQARSWLQPVITNMESILSDSKIMNDDKLLTEKEFNITSSPLSVLLRKVEKLQLTRVEILVAFMKKAALSERLPEDFNMANALATAVYQDWHRENLGNLTDRLHYLTGTSYKQLGLEQKMLVGETNGRESMNHGIYARNRVPLQFKF